MMNWRYAMMGLVLALLMATATMASAALDACLKLDGITGESRSSAHPGTIDLVGFSFGLSQESTIGSATGGAGSGKVSMQDLHVVKQLDSVSIPLFLACAGGKHFPTATLYMRKAGGDPADFMTVTLSEVFITNCTVTGQTQDLAPTESITLTYAKIEWQYRPQGPDGRLGAPIKGGWDLRANRLTGGAATTTGGLTSRPLGVEVQGPATVTPVKPTTRRTNVIRPDAGIILAPQQ